MNWFWTMWNGELSIKHCGCKWRSSLWIKPRQWKFNFGGKTSRNGWFSIAVQSFRTQFVHWAVSRVVAVSTPGHFFRKNMYECLPGQKGYPRSAKIVFVQGRRAISWRCVCQPSSRYNQLYFVVISSSRYRKWLIDVAVLNQFCLLEDFFTPRSSTNYASEISGRLVDTSQMSRTTSPSEYMVGQFFWVILQLIYLIKWRHPGSGSNYKGDIWTIQGSKPIFFLSTIRRCCASAGYRTRNNARSIRGVGKPGAAVRSEHNNYGNGKLKKKQVDQEHYLQNRHRKFEPFFLIPGRWSQTQIRHLQGLGRGFDSDRRNRCVCSGDWNGIGEILWEFPHKPHWDLWLVVILVILCWICWCFGEKNISITSHQCLRLQQWIPTVCGMRRMAADYHCMWGESVSSSEVHPLPCLCS